MRVLHVVANVADKTKGPAHSVPSLCAGLHALGANVELHTLVADREDRRSFPIVSHRPDPWMWSSSLRSSRSLRAALRDAASDDASILHSHSLWTMPTVYPVRAARGTPCKTVSSPRGTLTEWSLERSWWKKKAAWLLVMSSVLRRTDCLHATSPDEVQDFRRVGFLGPVAMIPNGIPIPPKLPSRTSPTDGRTLLFLSRIHPKKGLDRLLEAWAKLEPGHTDWQLLIAGPDNGGYLEEMRRLHRRLGLTRAQFVGPLLGQAKAEALRKADLFVLPTHSENFGLAIAEALAHGTPVVVGKGAPWGRVASKGCGWWIDNDVYSIESCLRHAMSLSSEALQSMGDKGRNWMTRDFSEEKVASEMLSVYHWLARGLTVPSCVER